MKHTPVDIAVAKGYDNLVHALGGRSTSLQRLNSTEHLFHLIRNHPANQSIWSTPPLFYVMSVMAIYYVNGQSLCNVLSSPHPSI